MGKVENIASGIERARELMRATGTASRMGRGAGMSRPRLLDTPEVSSALYLVPRPQRKARRGRPERRRQGRRPLRAWGTLLGAELLDGAYLLAALGAAALCWWSVQ